MGQKKAEQGFTLVEIMVVVTIVAILAALSIPNLLRARHNADEAAAIASIRAISTACENYRSSQTPPSYPQSLTALASASPPYIDSALANATSASSAKQGYYYTFTYLNEDQYTCLSTPKLSGVTGTRIFYVDETGVIRLTNSAGSPVE